MSEHQAGRDPAGGSDDDRGDGRAKPSRWEGAGLLMLRVGLPVSLAMAGLVLMLLDLLPIGIVLLGTAIIAVLVDFFARMTNESDREREREEQARRQFTATGRWPRGRR